MKRAFLFSGQGSQKVGMGADLYREHAIVRETFDEASEVLGYDLAEVCFRDDVRLQQTLYTQPAIVTLSVACWRLLIEQGFEPNYVAGFSLGEYAALVASGTLSFAECLAVVAKRALYMEACTQTTDGKMVAIINVPQEVMMAACARAQSLGIVAPANFNTPKQVVIGGEAVAVDAVVADLRAQGFKKCIPLNVRGAFHTPLFVPVTQKLQADLRHVKFAVFRVPLISNTTAKIMELEKIRLRLAEQVSQPVLFSESLQLLADLGVTEFIELGPGTVLSGFVKQTVPEAHICRVEDQATYEQTIKELSDGAKG